MKDVIRKGDAVFGFICLGLGFWLIIEALRFDYMTEFAPGPGFLPFWLGIVLGLFALFLIRNAFKREDNPEDQQDKEKGLPGGDALKRVGLILLMIAGLAFFMIYLGFIPAVIIFIFLILYFLEGYGIRKSIFYSLAFSASVFLIFQYWLEVQLPTGFLF